MEACAKAGGKPPARQELEALLPWNITLPGGPAAGQGIDRHDSQPPAHELLENAPQAFGGDQAEHRAVSGGHQAKRREETFRIVHDQQSRAGGFKFGFVEETDLREEKPRRQTNNSLQKPVAGWYLPRSKGRCVSQI